MSLAPVTASPRRVQAVALALGRLLKSTGRMEKGLGSVRQDINVSVGGGQIVEVKGVQQLDLVSRVLEYEVRRQLWLNELAGTLLASGLTEGDLAQPVVDVSRVLQGTGSKVVQAGLKKGGAALAMRVPLMSSLLGREPVPGVRLGRELSDVARFYRLGGLFHSDELPGNGVAEGEVEALKDGLGCGPGDAFVLLVGEPDRVRLCMDALSKRLQQALKGTPAETRMATQDGETRFIRPRPGSARMYPETDIPPVPVDSDFLGRIDGLVPPPWEEQVRDVMKKYGLGGEQAERILDSDHYQLFVRSVPNLRLQPTYVATLLTETVVSLRREGLDASALTEATLSSLLSLISQGAVAKEAAHDVLAAVIRGDAKDVEGAVSLLQVRGISGEELGRVIDGVLEAEGRLLQEKKMEAFSALMGSVMAEVRGKADGAAVSGMLREKMRLKLGAGQE